MLAKALIIGIFCVAASMQDAITPCPGLPTPQNLYINNCETGVCKFYKGSNVEAQWDFQTLSYTTSLRAEANITVTGGFRTREYKIQDAGLFSSLIPGQSFPIAPLQIRTFRFKMPVPKEAWPNIEFDSKFILIDNNNNIISCCIARAVVLLN